MAQRWPLLHIIILLHNAIFFGHSPPSTQSQRAKKGQFKVIADQKINILDGDGGHTGSFY